MTRVAVRGRVGLEIEARKRDIRGKVIFRIAETVSRMGKMTLAVG